MATIFRVRAFFLFRQRWFACYCSSHILITDDNRSTEKQQHCWTLLLGSGCSFRHNVDRFSSILNLILQSIRFKSEEKAKTEKEKKQMPLDQHSSAFKSVMVFAETPSCVWGMLHLLHRLRCLKRKINNDSTVWNFSVIMHLNYLGGCAVQICHGLILHWLPIFQSIILYCMTLDYSSPVFKREVTICKKWSAVHFSVLHPS